MAVTAENLVSIFCKIPLFSKELVQVSLCKCSPIYSLLQKAVFIKVTWNLPKQTVYVCLHAHICVLHRQVFV